MDMPCLPALDPLVSAMQRYLGAATTSRVGAHLRLDNDYFNRMDALNYAEVVASRANAIAARKH